MLSLRKEAEQSRRRVGRAVFAQESVPGRTWAAERKLPSGSAEKASDTARNEEVKGKI